MMACNEMMDNELSNL